MFTGSRTYLINSTPVLEINKQTKKGKTKEKQKKKERKSSQCLSYKDQKGRGGGGSHPHKQSEELGGVLWVYKAGLK